MANMYKSTLENVLTPTGNATSADVLSGKTFMNANGAQTGSMTNNGAVSGVATPTQPYTIPAGFHNGSGTVTASGGSANLVLADFSAQAVAVGSHSVTLEDGEWYLITCQTTAPAVRGINNFTGCKNVSSQPSGDNSPKYFMFQADGTTFTYTVYGYTVDSVNIIKISTT